MDMYQKALDLQPDVASTVYNLGLVYLNAQRLDDAIQTFRRSITIDPQLAEAWADLGVAYFAKSELEKSAQYLKIALEKDPSHIRARRNLSIVLTKLGRCIEAQNLMLTAPDGNNSLNSWPEEVKSCRAAH
jgi:tetratricopeptide (TPR) repeat protein